MTTTQDIAQAFGVSPQWLDAHHTTPSHTLGLWNCEDEGFYRYIFTQTRAAEGADWITHPRTGQQLADWWAAYQRRKETPHA